MSARSELERRIELEKQQNADLRRQVERGESFIQGLEEALKLIPKDEQKQTHRVSSRTQKGHGKSPFRGNSDTGRVYQVLQTSGKMHIGDILVAIGKEDTKANRMSLASSLGRYVRKNHLFERPEPNTFAVKKQSISNARNTIAPQLPPEFGAEEKIMSSS